MVHKVIVQIGWQQSFSHNRKLLLRVMIEKFPGSVVFPYLFWFLQLKFRLGNFDMFVGCWHSSNYNSVRLSILINCAKVPGLCPDIGPFFFFFFFIPCGIENPFVRKHHMHLKFCKSALVKYIIFQIRSSIRTRNFPFSGSVDCIFVHVHLKCFSLKVHTCRVS